MGGGGGSDGLARQQEQREQARLAEIQRGIAATNGVYDSPQRQAQINDFLEANRQMYFKELGTQKQDADRQLKFAVARNGQQGGKQSIDAAANLGEKYNKGVVDADRLAQRGANDLRMADEEARSNLIALINSGVDATTASNRATAGLQTSLAGARANMGPEALGQVFGSFGDLYKRSKERDEERRARTDLNSLYGTAGQWGYSGGK